MLIILIAGVAYALGGGALPASLAEAVTNPGSLGLAFAVLVGMVLGGRR